MKFRNKLKFDIPPIYKLDAFFYLASISAICGTAYIIYSTYNSLPSLIPFFYGLPWGIAQLANKSYLWGILGLSAVIFLLNFTMSMIEKKKKNQIIANLYIYIGLGVNIALLSYTFKIIHNVLTRDLYIEPWIRLIAIPLFIALVATTLITPLVIKMARKFNFMDDPLRHKHPGMLLSKPTPRAGGLAFFLGVFIPAALFLPILQSQKLVGILLGAALCVFVGLRDDKKDVNPYLRASLQIVAVLITVMSGIILIYIPNPFGEAINLDNYKYVIEYMGTHQIYYVSVIAATVWMLIMMNFMSFANGSDGVFAGLISITALVIAYLMFTSLETDPELDVFIKLAALIAGAGFGMAVFTWPPQKILWGYGSTGAALMIAALSVIGSTKVATTILVLMIPLLDGVFAVIRRISRGQMPLWGDREHLHHKLLEDLNWSKEKVAVFYWGTTISFAIIGIATSGKARAISLATSALIIVLGISFLNIFRKPKLRNRSVSQEP